MCHQCLKIVHAILVLLWSTFKVEAFLFPFHHSSNDLLTSRMNTRCYSSSDGITSDSDSIEKMPILIQAALGRKTDRTPVWMMRQAGRHMACYRELCKKYTTFRQRSEIPEAAIEISLQPVRQYDTDGCILFSDILTPLPGLGCDFEIDEKLGPVMGKPIRDWDGFKTMNQLDPTVSTSFVGETLNELRKEIPSSTALLGFVGAPYTLATYIIEGKTSKLYLETKKMASEEPKLLHSMLKLIAENIGNYACYQIENGAQLIQLFDSWAGELNPKDYDEFAAPYQKIVLDIIKSKYPNVPTVIYIKHSGSLIERMAKTGVDVVSLDWTVDLSEGCERINKARAEIGLTTPGGLQGNLDPAILLLDSQDVIGERTEEILRKGRSSGSGHVMNLGHGVEATTSEENAHFFIDFVKNFKHDEN